MTDRELLELAAKAAGIEILRSRLDDPLWKDMLLAAKHSVTPGIAEGWNPLTDDGDALRLAVKLHLNVGFIWDGENDQYDPVYAMRGKAYADEQIGITIKDEFDEFSATRRAIVRAAAEIGKRGA